MMTDKQKGLIYISGTIFSWGVLAIILKVINQKVDSYTIVWSRFMVAYIVLFIYLTIKDKKLLKIQYSPPKLPLLAALLLGANYLGFMKGVELTTPSNTQILIQIGPISLAVLGIFFLKEKISKRQLAGFIIAVIGFGFFYKNQIESLLETTNYNLGVIWILMAAISWAIYAIIQKSLVRTYDSRSLNLIIYGVPAIIYLFFADFNLLSSLDFITLFWLFLLGLNTIIAYGCLTESFKYLPANQISILITLNPLITIFLMQVLNFFQVSWAPVETITMIGFLGALLVLIGAILVVSKKRKIVN